MLLEDELIQKCVCGDRFAQKELYERYSPVLFAICVRYMPTVEDAEDVLIIGFTSIFAKLGMFNFEGNFEGWMKRIIVNTAIDALRVNSRRYEMQNESEKWNNSSVSVSENMIYSHVNVKYIIKQIQQMPTGYKTVFNLSAVEGYSYEEISKMLGISIGTVRSQLAKARKILQRKLQMIE